MRPVLTPSEAAALDRECEGRGITTSALMENAGRAVARAAVDVCGGVYGRRAVAVCGKGNNAGDGLAAARFLSEWGMRVSVVLLADAANLSPAAAANHGRLSDVRILAYSGEALERELDRADVVLDAIFGTGFRGKPEGEYAAAIAAMNVCDAAILAIDIPSGVNGESAAVAGEAVRADVTVSLGVAKAGVVLFPGAANAGVVEVADIGIPADLIASELNLVEREDVEVLIPVRPPDTSKRSSGVVLVAAGSRTMTGAAAMVAEAAYRAGAGLVTIAVPEGIVPVVEASVTEATFIPIPETKNGSASADGLKTLWDRLGSFDSFAVGPGLGVEEEAQEFARSIVAAVPNPVVVDADGLNAFAGRAGELRDRGTEAVVLTPHEGEFARLSGRSAEEIEADRVEAVRELARETEATVLLKGSRSLIGSFIGEVRINPTGSSALATAGSGDVLTGTIAAMLARGLAPEDAATAGAYVHGLAGLAAAREMGEGTTARAVLERLPAAIQQVRPA